MTIRDGKPGETWHVQHRNGGWADWEIITDDSEQRAIARSLGYGDDPLARCLRTGYDDVVNYDFADDDDHFHYVDRLDKYIFDPLDDLTWTRVS